MYTCVYVISYLSRTNSLSSHSFFLSHMKLNRDFNLQTYLALLPLLSVKWLHGIFQDVSMLVGPALKMFQNAVPVDASIKCGTVGIYIFLNYFFVISLSVSHFLSIYLSISHLFYHNITALVVTRLTVKWMIKGNL